MTLTSEPFAWMTERVAQQTPALKGGCTSSVFNVFIPREEKFRQDLRGVSHSYLCLETEGSGELGAWVEPGKDEQ